MPEADPLPDFGAAWRDWLTQSERQWNAVFNQMMGTEEFSQGLGRNLDLFLHFQKTMNEAMGSYFMAINVPTRTDVLELGERLLAIENRIASIEAALVALNTPPAAHDDGAPSQKPRRTKQPPAAAHSNDN